MKLFKTKELKQLLEMKEYIIDRQKRDIDYEMNVSEIKDRTIEDLSKEMKKKDKRIADLWKDMNQLSLQNGQYFDTIKMAADENLKLKDEIKRLTSGIKAGIIQPETVALTISYKKPEFKANELAKEIRSNLTRINGKKPYKEHVCTSKCFGKHVLRAIQKDFNSIDPRYLNDCNINIFLEHWNTRLKEEYKWLDYIYLKDDYIFFHTIL